MTKVVYFTTITRTSDQNTNENAEYVHGCRLDTVAARKTLFDGVERRSTNVSVDHTEGGERETCETFVVIAVVVRGRWRRSR
jgi:hypothetical protein